MTSPKPETSLTRRDFLARTGAAAAMVSAAPLLGDAHLSRITPLVNAPAAVKRYPIGIELYAVRKELARRDPKHAWPENPLQAQLPAAKLPYSRSRDKR